jgi:outer membrane protein TolC
MARRPSVTEALATWRRACRRLDRATRARVLAAGRADAVRIARAEQRVREARLAEIAAHSAFRRAREAVEDLYGRTVGGSVHSRIGAQ